MSFERAQLLLAHGRPADAEQALRETLAREPEDPASHAMLALCLDQLDRMEEALEAAKRAVGLAPEWAFPHYVLAVVRVDLKRAAEADAALDEAIALDPHLAEAFALKAVIRLGRGEWADAQAQAELALALEPEDETALNVRAQALIKQGKVEEAKASMASGLALHPDAAGTHLNQGWILLEAGDHLGAMDHFAEALRLDPTMDGAREGYITALKARSLFYRWFLGFQFWLSRFSAGSQWMFLIGFWVLSQVVRGAEQAYPAWTPVLEPIRWLYLGFVLLSWVADPLLDLALRFSRRGKLLLAPHQRLGAELFGATLALALALALAVLLTGSNLAARLFVVAGLAVLPVGVTFRRADPHQRRVLGVITGVIVASALAGELLPHGGQAFAITPIAFIIFVLTANSYAIRRPL